MQKTLTTHFPPIALNKTCFGSPLLTLPLTSPVPCRKATACLAEDRHNTHREQSELNPALSFVKFPWRTSLLGWLKTCNCKNQEEKIPDELTGTPRLWENHPPSVPPFPRAGSTAWLGGKARIRPRGRERSTSIGQGSCNHWRSTPHCLL